MNRVQQGLNPVAWKPMRSVAKGVREIRIRHEGQYRLIYLLVREEAVYVLHVFHKKTQRTPAAVVRVARQRLADLTRWRVRV